MAGKSSSKKLEKAHIPITGMTCTTLRDSGQDAHTVAVTKELIKRDILFPWAAETEHCKLPAYVRLKLGNTLGQDSKACVRA